MALAVRTAVAQVPNVQLDVWSGEGYQPCEPSIAMDPNNPDVVVAGSIMDNVYRSEDGGVTWAKDKLPRPLGCLATHAWWRATPATSISCT